MHGPNRNTSKERLLPCFQMQALGSTDIILMIEVYDIIDLIGRWDHNNILVGSNMICVEAAPTATWQSLRPLQ